MISHSFGPKILFSQKKSIVFAKKSFNTDYLSNADAKSLFLEVIKFEIQE